MAKTIDLRTYLLLERAFVRRLQRSWRQRSAPIYQKITQACLDHKWDEARRLVPDLDLAEVGTENREWITYMLLSCAVFGAGIVSKKKPSFVGVGTFDTFLKQVTSNFLQYLEFSATAQVQAEAMQSIAEDEAKTKALALKWDESQHPRDKEGQFTGLPPGYTLHTESTASYSGQTNYTTRVRDAQGEQVAYADYVVFEERHDALDRKLHPHETRPVASGRGGVYRPEVTLSMIEVSPEHRRKGIGLAMLRGIAKEHGLPVNSGMRTEEGGALWQAWLNRPERLKWEEAQHPRDKEGQFTASGTGNKELIERNLAESKLVGGGGPERARWRMLSDRAAEAADAYFDAKDAHRDLTHQLEEKYGNKGALEYGPEDYATYRNSQAALQTASRLMDAADAAVKRQEPAMRVEVVTNISTGVALSMGIDPAMIHVVDKDPPEFKVGEKVFTEAGHYSPGELRIELNARNVSYAQGEVVEGITAHEISHRVWHGLQQASDEEFQRYLRKAVTSDGQHHTAWYHERFGGQVGDVVIHSERRLKPEYQEEMTKEFPAATVLAGLAGGELFTGIAQEMIEEDGHSAYAKSYWSPEARAARGHSYDTAINETIAEVTRYLISPRSWHEDKTPDMASPWTKFTIAMHTWWHEGSELRKAGIARVRAEHKRKVSV